MSVTCQASALAVGTFSLQLTASAGEGSCANSTTKDITITVDPKPNITLTGDPSCNVCAEDDKIVLNYTASSGIAGVPVNITVPQGCNASGGWACLLIGSLHGTGCRALAQWLSGSVVQDQQHTEPVEM